MLTLKFSGTTGLAAYSILANIALVLVAIFTGIGQGIQPIVSSHPGKNGAPVRNQVRRYALSTALLWLSLPIWLSLSLQFRLLTYLIKTRIRCLLQWQQKACAFTL